MQLLHIFLAPNTTFNGLVMLAEC